MSILDDRLLDSRVAWVTGAGRGLGRAIARGLAAAGADVVVSSRTREELDETVAQIKSDGGHAVAVVADVTDPDQIDHASQVAHDLRGHLDVLVNNAGVSSVFVRSENLRLEDWKRTLEVNLTGAFMCAQVAGRYMLAGSGGSIVNISSVHGRTGAQRLAAYAASKGGLELLTRTLAVEWADRGVRVNAVAPGYFETDFTKGLRNSKVWRDVLLRRIPQGRFGTPHEVVGAVLFLASDLSTYVTGSTLAVDGGWTA
ncbi:MAG TPA: glucose 1-dehydrogenase [Thermopolyspora sp.]|jgi:Dehydrogenases with different specificities (related to short-chain alcohol dehydrogenases)